MIKVLSASFGLTLQDLGRKGYGSHGVPTSGVMDAYSARLVNLLLQNDENAAVLEVAFGGCKLKFKSDCYICISGADFSVVINGKGVPLNKVLQVKADSILSFSKRKFGVRTYIGVQGGFQTESVLGSRSLYKGITSKGLIAKGDVLQILPIVHSFLKSYASIRFNKNHFDSSVIECSKGPEFYLLSEAQKEMLRQPFTISSNNSRMGVQLEELVENDFSSMLTSAVLHGTVQLTPSGKLIVLMRDCQVTGGYPRILQLTENAIDRLSQKSTGGIIKLKLFTE